MCSPWPDVASAVAAPIVIIFGSGIFSVFLAVLVAALVAKAVATDDTVENVVAPGVIIFIALFAFFLRLISEAFQGTAAGTPLGEETLTVTATNFEIISTVIAAAILAMLSTVAIVVVGARIICRRRLEWRQTILRRPLAVRQMILLLLLDVAGVAFAIYEAVRLAAAAATQSGLVVLPVEDRLNGGTARIEIKAEDPRVRAALALRYRLGHIMAPVDVVAAVATLGPVVHPLRVEFQLYDIVRRRVRATVVVSQDTLAAMPRLTATRHVDGQAVTDGDGQASTVEEYYRGADLDALLNGRPARRPRAPRDE